MNVRVSVRVECSPGHHGEDTPQALYCGDRRIVVDRILDRWPGKDHRYFKIRGSDGALYIIRHDLLTGVWELTLFEQP